MAMPLVFLGVGGTEVIFPPSIAGFHLKRNPSLDDYWVSLPKVALRDKNIAEIICPFEQGKYRLHAYGALTCEPVGRG